MGDTTQALRAAERALAIAEKSVGSEHPLVADCLSSLADIQTDCRRFDLAICLEKRALAINERISGQEHPDVFRNLRAMAQIEILASDLPEAVSTIGELAGRQRNYLARHFQTSSWKIASRVADVFRESSEILQTLCAATAGNPTNSITVRAAQNCALNKGFWEEVQAAHAALEANQETRVAELHTEYGKVESQLVRLPETEPDADKRDAKRLELESRLSKITSELAHRVGIVAQRILEEKTSLRDIAQELPQGAALVDFVQYRRYDFAAKTNQWKEQHYAAYLTFPLAPGSTNLLVESVDLGEARLIDEAVRIVCQRMSAGQYVADDLSVALRRLSELVYWPLSKHLANSSHLIICPDGQLSRLPFEMLLTGRSMNGGSSGPDRCLIEDKMVSYVGSGREIVRFQSGAPTGASPQAGRSADAVRGGGSLTSAKSLVMGNPDFDLDLEGTRPGEAKISAGTTPLRSLTRDYHGLRFGPLPGAEAEARGIAKLLGDGTLLKLGPDAREAELRAAVSPQVLLLATHGFFFSDQELRRTNSPLGAFLARGIARQRSFGEDWENPMMRCGIALAGANRSFMVTNSVAEDGLLTGLEASMLDLQGTELVILSACDSGNGEVKIGEGVMSLQRAFRIAGAQTVLASHWEVSDKATDGLMTKFIELWRSGKPRAQAWREAQLTLAHSKDFSSPYFWAAFTLTGHWK
jgi:CHAT domain-containing protein